MKPMQNQPQYDRDAQLVRFAILNGVTPPAQSVARLEARGIDVGELEARIRQSIEWRH
jgi:hypothetical protein